MNNVKCVVECIYPLRDHVKCYIKNADFDNRHTSFAGC